MLQDLAQRIFYSWDRKSTAKRCQLGGHHQEICLKFGEAEQCLRAPRAGPADPGSGIYPSPGSRAGSANPSINTPGSGGKVNNTQQRAFRGSERDLHRNSNTARALDRETEHCVCTWQTAPESSSVCWGGDKGNMTT